MPQEWLPNLPGGETIINNIMSVTKRDGRYYYFCRELPVFFHSVEDKDSFRMYTAQLCVSGMAKQAEIVRAFGVSTISVKRSVKKHREKGGASFFVKKSGGGPTVITSKVVEDVERLLSEGFSRRDVSKELDVNYSAICKAIQTGRIKEEKKL